MRIGVAADSGGDVAALCRAFRLMQEDLRCSRLFFLGGNFVDVDGYQEATLEQALPAPVSNADSGLLDMMAAVFAPPPPPKASSDEPRVVRVCERDGPPQAERKSFEMLGTHLCLLVHNKGDLDRDDISNAPVILHGKARKHAVVRIGTRTFITPGALTGVDAPSVAVLEPTGAQLAVSFHAMDGSVLHQESVPLGGPTKFSAR